MDVFMHIYFILAALISYFLFLLINKYNDDYCSRRYTLIFWIEIVLILITYENF